MKKREKNHLFLVFCIGLVSFFYQNCLHQKSLSSDQMGGNGDGYLGMQYVAFAPESQCGGEPVVHGSYQESLLNVFLTDNRAVRTDSCGNPSQEVALTELYHFEKPDIYIHNATIYAKDSEVDLSHPLIIGLCIPDAPLPGVPSDSSNAPAIPSIIVRASVANGNSPGFAELVAQAVYRLGDQQIKVGPKVQISSQVTEEEIIFEPLSPQSVADDEFSMPKQLRVNIAVDPDFLIDGVARSTHAGSLILATDLSVPLHCFRSSWAVGLLSTP